MEGLGIVELKGGLSCLGDYLENFAGTNGSQSTKRLILPSWASDALSIAKHLGYVKDVGRHKSIINALYRSTHRLVISG